MARSYRVAHHQRIHRGPASPPNSGSLRRDEPAPGRVRRGWRQARAHRGAVLLAAAISLPTVCILVELALQLYGGS
jgi:hypothetical protein